MVSADSPDLRASSAFVIIRVSRNRCRLLIDTFSLRRVPRGDGPAGAAFANIGERLRGLEPTRIRFARELCCLRKRKQTGTFQPRQTETAGKVPIGFFPHAGASTVRCSVAWPTEFS